MTRRRVCSAVAASAAALVLAPAASAHAYLVRSVPAAGAVTATAPHRVLLAFDEDVLTAGVDVTRAGTPVVRGDAFAPRGRPNEIVAPLAGRLADGGYVVRWRVVDRADGHVISGSFSFAVGGGARAPTVAVASGGDFRGGAAAARWLLLVGLLVAAGTVAFRRLVWRPRAFAITVASALAVAAVGAGLLLALQPDPLGTRFGKLTLTGASVAAVAAATALASVRRPRLGPVAEAAAVLLLALPTLSGHALAHGPSHLLSVPSDLVHLAAASVWTGGIFCLVVVSRFERAAPLASLTRRFARVAAIAVVALAVTGLVRAVGELQSFSQLWTISYGRGLLVKAGLLVVLVALAAAYRGRPRRGGLAAELGLLAVVVGTVAVVTGLRPGVDHAAPAAAASTADATVVVAAPADDLAVGLALTPRGTSSVEARAKILAPSGPANGLGVHVRVSGRWMRATPCGAGCYAAVSTIRSRPTGLAVRLERTGRRPATAHFREPATWPAPPAASIVSRAAQTFRDLRTLSFSSRLASSPTNETTTIWEVQAPDRLSYRELETGSGAVIVGTRRWDRESARSPWQESPQYPVHQPAPPWPRPFRSAHVLGSTRRAWIVSFADPVTPSWFTIAVDKQSYRTLWVEMIATAHFMDERYYGFDAPTAIVPPRG